MREKKKYDWGDSGDKQYRKFGDGLVFRGPVMYDYDDDCWRYAIDVYYAFQVDGGYMDDIDESEAKSIVEKNGGSNFDDIENVLFVSEDGEFVGV